MLPQLEDYFCHEYEPPSDPRGVLWGSYPNFGWPIHDFHVLVLQQICSGSGSVGQSIILDQDKVVLDGVGSCPQKETLFQYTPVFLLVHSAAKDHQLTFATIVKSSWMTCGPTLPSVPCTQTSMCFAPCHLHTWARPSSGGCPKHDNVLPMVAPKMH